MVIDTKNPTVTVDIADASLSDGDNSSLVTFTFSEAATDFRQCRRDGGWRHAEHADDRRRHGDLDGDVHGDRRRRDHRLGDGDAGGYTDAAGNIGGGDSDTVVIDTQEPDGDGGHRRWLAERRRHQLAGDVHVQRGGDRLQQCRCDGGWRHAGHADRPATDGLTWTATFTATDGVATTGSVTVTRRLHRRGRQHRRRRLRHGGDRQPRTRR